MTFDPKHWARLTQKRKERCTGRDISDRASGRMYGEWLRPLDPNLIVKNKK